MTTYETEFWSRVAKGTGCWLWIANKDRSGYGRFNFKGVRKPAHRVSYELSYGHIESNNFICHRCDEPSCVRPGHLFQGTQFDNMLDMTKKGRRAAGKKVSNPGELNPAAKLTVSQVADIRYRYSNEKISQIKLATQYGVSQQVISNIILRKNWR